MSAKEKIKNLSPDELRVRMEQMGEPAYRADQILKWLYEAKADSFDAMTNLSSLLRRQLSEAFEVISVRPLKVECASDGAKKILYELGDGRTIESVLIPGGGRLTLCVSSQAGCALGCRFCLTGRRGFRRNLEAAEIIDQVMVSRKEAGPVAEITNIVFMGMGEPFLNFANVVRALQTLTSPGAMGIAPRRITVSTSGITDRVRQFGRLGLGRLAVSLNAPDGKLRARIMPVTRRYPLKKLLDACRNYKSPVRGKITFEYVLLEGLNDSERDAEKLGRLLKGIQCKINLIPFNECEELEYRRPGEAGIERFHGILRDRGYDVLLRDSRGKEISAACGQLGGIEVGKT